MVISVHNSKLNGNEDRRSYMIYFCVLMEIEHQCEYSANKYDRKAHTLTVKHAPAWTLCFQTLCKSTTLFLTKRKIFRQLIQKRSWHCYLSIFGRDPTWLSTLRCLICLIEATKIASLKLAYERAQLINNSWMQQHTYIVLNYNMVCSALFLQRALYTVHCTNIMHSRKPSFVITPAVFS